MRLDHLLSKEEQVESCFVVQLSSENLITAFRVAMRSGDTPVPIPNTMVKTWAADGTMLETAWESRWLPGSFSEEKELAGVAQESRMYLENCTQSQSKIDDII